MLVQRFLVVLLGLLLMFSIGCEKEKAEPSPPQLILTPTEVSGKSGETVEAELTINAPNGVKELVITKTIDLSVDTDYGTNGVKTAVPNKIGDNEYEYKFSYELQDSEVEKLVGFNFKIIDIEDLTAEKDLTVEVTMSARQIIYSRNWRLVSRMWTSVSPPEDDLDECDKDDVYTWNEDGTYGVDFGEVACDFDGFNVFDSWTLSEDEKTFTQVYYSIFDPEDITVEEYSVKTLNKDKMVMEIMLDLSAFGDPYTDEEVFEYIYESID